MKHFTLLAALAATFIATGAYAQTNADNAILPAKAKAMIEKFKKTLRTVDNAKHTAKALRAKRADATPIWRATHDVQYSYDEGDWYKEADNTYTFNAQGQTLTQVQYAYGEYAKLENTYNDKGQVTAQKMYTSTDGTNYTLYADRTQEYDDITGYSTKYESKISDGEGGTTMGSGSNYTTIERNADGNITKITKYTYSSSDEMYSESERTELTYANGGNAPTAITSYGTDDYGRYGIQDQFTDMTWTKSNGQLTGTSELDFVSEDNVLKSATLVDEEVGDIYIDVTEANDKGEFTMKMTMDGYPTLYQTTSLKYTDDNGSYRYATEVYANNQLAYTDYMVATIDDHGNSVLLEEWESPDNFQPAERIDGTKHEYKYDGEHGEMTEDIESALDDDDTYTPAMKIVYDKFVDAVATSVKGISGNTADQPATYYNLQGMKVNGDAKGLYIMKQGDKTVKIMK